MRRLTDHPDPQTRDRSPAGAAPVNDDSVDVVLVPAAAVDLEVLAAVDALADWSSWMALHHAIQVAPTTPGVYMAREATGGVVYVGFAGERSGKGIRGRLTVYRSGKAAVSGLGEAAMDRALADPDWLRARLVEAEAGRPLRAKQWGSAALDRADLHVRWASTTDGAAARSLEKAVLAVMRQEALWNRRR